MVENAGMIPEVIVVDATVDGVSKFRDKMRISLTIPAFKSDYPTTCTDFPDGMDAAVKVDESHRLELRRQNRVPGKGDGSKPFHYYWGINGRSEETPTVFAEAPVRTPDAQPPGNGLRNDPTGISIERQTAFKGVVEIYVAKINNGHLGGAQMLSLWDDIFQDTERAAAMIHGGHPPEEATPPSAEAPPDQHDAPPEDEAQQEALDSLGHNAEEAGVGHLGEFMEKAAQYGYPSGILKKLGVEKPVDILPKYGTFDAAMKKLATP